MPVWVDGATHRGYKAEQFKNAWLRVLGVRDVRDVRTESNETEAPNTPNAPNAIDADGGEASDLPPCIGDELYALRLAEAGNHGHVTAEEFSHRYRLHKAVERIVS